MSALGKLTATEAKLLMRDPGTLFVVIGIPMGLVLVFGLIPGMKQPNEEFGGEQPLSTFIAPMAITLLLGMLALNILPAYLATYREKGILRRLAASPVHPANLLVSQLAVQLLSALIMIAVVLGVGIGALGIETPGNPLGWLLALVLGIISLFSIGLLIAAVAPSGKVANGIGMMVFFPMLALGGVWVPKERLPEALQQVADVLPFGATLGALRETWAGEGPNVLQMVTLAVFALVAAAAAAKIFRWE
ncbi:MAG: ABC transporter permease subunit [Pseudonocardiaceae bacterium]|nr:ABC transporter permease subunit [Pseudonocardiaceae bacterium]